MPITSSVKDKLKAKAGAHRRPEMDALSMTGIRRYLRTTHILAKKLSLIDEERRALKPIAPLE